MPRPGKPWENKNPNAPKPAPKPRARKPASEAHKRGLADDYRKAPEDQRATFLRSVACAQYKDYYKGRMTVLYEAIDAAYNMATDKTDLDALMRTIAADLQAIKDGAALLNKDTPPGVVATTLANSVRKPTLGKTSPIRLPIPKEETMPREVKQTPLEPTPGKLTGGLFGDKKPDTLFSAPGMPSVPDMDTSAHPLDEFVPPASEPAAEAKPVCLNDWALDKDKRRLFIEKVDGLAFDAMIDAKNARAWGLGILGVPDETQIAMSASDAIKAIKATLPKPEPAAQPEPPAETEKPTEPTPPPVQSPTTILAQITTLSGIPIKDMRRKLDAKYDPKDYKAIKLSGGRQGTDVNSYAVRDRIEQVFGPHGLGWKIEPHSILGAVNIERETTTGQSGERSVWVVSLIEHVFSYRIILPDGTLEWVELSVMSDSADNSDKGYAYRSAFTSLLKQVVRSLGGLNHLRNS